MGVDLVTVYARPSGSGYQGRFTPWFRRLPLRGKALTVEMPVGFELPGQILRRQARPNQRDRDCVLAQDRVVELPVGHLF